MAQRNAEMYSTSAAPGTSTSAAATATPPSVAAFTPHSTSSKSYCYFCGRTNHPRLRCPARNSICHKCNKKGHFASVCKSRNNRRAGGSAAAAATETPSSDLSDDGEDDVLAMITVSPDFRSSAEDALLSAPLKESAATSPCISVKGSTLVVSVNNANVKALVDSGSTSSFINPEIVQKLNLPILASKQVITMASSPLSSSTEGHCFVQLKVKDNLYSDFKLSVLPNLCTNVILGRDFMRLHKSVEFGLNGSRPKLTVCSVACMTVEPPSLFPSLTPDCKPIATQTRKFSKADQSFIHNEIESFLGMEL